MNIFEQLITIDEYIKKHKSKPSGDKAHSDNDPETPKKPKGKKRKPLEDIPKDIYNIFNQGTL